MALTDVSYLRYLLDDRIPEGGTDAETFFTDSDLTDILNANYNHMYASAFAGWMIRAADYHRLIDLDESGSSKELSQLWDHSIRMARQFARQIPESIAEGVFSSVRVVGKAISLREYPEWMDDPGEDVQFVPTK